MTYKGITQSFTIEITSDGSDLDAGNGIYSIAQTQAVLSKTSYIAGSQIILTITLRIPSGLRANYWISESLITVSLNLIPATITKTSIPGVYTCSLIMTKVGTFNSIIKIEGISFVNTLSPSITAAPATKLIIADIFSKSTGNLLDANSGYTYSFDISSLD